MTNIVQEPPFGVSTYQTNAYNYTGEKVILNGETAVTYDVSYCGDAVLYYLNSHCGIDAFLIEGGVKRVDKYSQMDYYKSYDNTTKDFGKRRYLTDVDRTWELTTCWLSDEEAERLARNLLPSTQVYLTIFGDNEVQNIPVNITDTSTEYKTYENQNYQLVSYKINVSASQGDKRNI